MTRSNTTTTTTNDGDHTDVTATRRKVHVLLYECSIPTGNIIRKIKLGHYYDSDSDDSNHHNENDPMMMMRMNDCYNTEDNCDIHQPWLSILDQIPSPTNHNAVVATVVSSPSIVTYLLSATAAAAITTEDDTNGSRIRSTSNRRSTSTSCSTSSSLVLRGMNLDDGSKLYKTSIPTTLRKNVPLPRTSRHNVVVVSSILASSSTSTTSLSISVSIDPYGMIQLFDTITGHPIVAHESQRSEDTEDTIPVTTHYSSSRDNEHDRTDGPRRLQVVLTEVPPSNDESISTTTPSKKTKKNKRLTQTKPSEDMSLKYCLWILIDEATVLPILLRQNKNKELTTTTIPSENQNEYGYMVQAPYPISCTNGDDVDDTSMRCHLMIQPHSHNSNTKYPLPQLMVFQSSQLQAKTLNSMQVQTIPLSIDMDFGKDHTIPVVFDKVKDTNNLKHDHPMMIEETDDDVDNDLTAHKTTMESTKKRKPSLTTVLGPGQAGGEARHVTEGNDDHPKRMKRTSEEGDDHDDDIVKLDHEPTIAERLRLLQQALDAEEEDDDDNDENAMDDNDNTELNADGDNTTPRRTTKNENKFVVKYATTESLTQLLIQALQSSDGTMLEQAFQVRDKNILRTTCQALTSDQVLVLLDALIQRLASKPSRAEQLVAWVSAILQSNQITNVQHLQPLQNLLSERLEVFPLLLQLEGRLENMIGM